MLGVSVEGELARELCSDLHQENVVELVFLDALLLEVVLKGDVLVTQAGGELLACLLDGDAVDEVADLTFEALGQLVSSEHLSTAVVFVLVLGLELLRDLLAQVLEALHAGHCGFCPGVVQRGRLHVDDALYGNGSGVFLHDRLTVGAELELGTLEGEALRLTDFHADDCLVEVVGHGQCTGVVLASVSAQRLDFLAILRRFHGKLDLVAFDDNVVGVVSHSNSCRLGHLLDFLIDLGRLDLLRGKRDGNGLVALQFEFGHGYAHEVEDERRSGVCVLKALVDGLADDVDFCGSERERRAMAHDPLVEDEGGFVCA